MRMILMDRWGAQKRTLSDIISAEWTEELGGEDSLAIECGDPVAKGDRVVWLDAQGLWHEHTVAEVEQAHGTGAPTYRATCENSISELYGDFVEDRKPREESAAVALAGILQTSRWDVGDVTVEGSHSTNFYRTSAREALQSLMELWGGELSTTIEVDGCAVTARKVNLTRRGTDTGRRFTYSRDMTEVVRTFSADDVVTAMYGYGKGEEVGDGYGRGIDFADINGGKAYVENPDALALWGRPDGEGGIAHVFGKYENSDCTDPEELLELTRAALDEASSPKVSYEASMAVMADYGYDFAGVALGDDIALIDTALEPQVRVRGRVTRLVRDMADGGRITDITVGNIVEGIDSVLAGQYADVQGLKDRSTAWDVAATTPAAYIQQVMDGLNKQFDEGASYVYQSPTMGIVIGSVPLDQETGLPTRLPASAIQLAGGGFRIANSLKGDGTWNWRTFGTGDGFTADLILTGTLEAGLITAGVLSDSKGNNFWDLDNGVFSLSSGTTVGGKTVQQYADEAAEEAKGYTDELDGSLDQQEVFDRLTGGGQAQGIYLQGGKLYINGSYIASGVIDADLIKAGTITDASGDNVWDLTTGDMTLAGDLTVKGGRIMDASGRNIWDLVGDGMTLGNPSTTISAGRIEGAGDNWWDLNTGQMSLDFMPDAVQDYVDTQIAGVESDISSVSGRVTTAQSAANRAQSTANAASNTASAAKAKTDRITFTSSGMNVIGTNGATATCMTYGSGGVVTAGALSEIRTNQGTMGVKDWGFSFINNSGTVGIWVTAGADEGGTGEPNFTARFPGGSIIVGPEGGTINGKKILTE